MPVRNRFIADSGGGGTEQDDEQQSSSSSSSTSSSDDAESTADRAARAAQMGAPVDADIKPATPEGTDEEVTASPPDDVENMAPSTSATSTGEESSRSPTSTTPESQIERMATGGGPRATRSGVADDPEPSTDSPDDRSDSGGVSRSTTGQQARPPDGSGESAEAVEDGIEAGRNLIAGAVQDAEETVDRTVDRAEETLERNNEEFQQSEGNVDQQAEYVASAEVNREVTDELTQRGGALSEDQEDQVQEWGDEYEEMIEGFVGSDTIGNPNRKGPVENTLEGVSMGAASIFNVPRYISAGETAIETAQNAPGVIQDEGAGEVAETATAVTRETVEQTAESVREEPGRQGGQIAGSLLGGAAATRAARRAGSAARNVDVPSQAQQARNLLQTDPEDLGSSQRSDLGTGGTGSLLDADAVDSARGVSGPSRRSLARGRARRTRERIADGVGSTRDRLRGSDEAERFTDFVSDDRAQATPGGMGLRRSDTDSDDFTEFSDYDGGTDTSTADPTREVILENSPRDLMSDDVSSRSLSQRQGNAGDYDGSQQDRLTRDPDGGSQRDREIVRSERQRREEVEQPFEDADTDTPSGESTLADIQTGSGAGAGAFAGFLSSAGASDALSSNPLGVTDSTPSTWQGVGPLGRTGPTVGTGLTQTPGSTVGPGERTGPTQDEETDTLLGPGTRTGPVQTPGSTTGTTPTPGTDGPGLTPPGSDSPGSPLGPIGGSPPGGRRPRGGDDTISDSSPNGFEGLGLGGLSETGDDELSPDWLSETVTTIATRGGPVSSPSQSALEDAASDGVGGLPTAQMLGGSDDTQEDIEAVTGLLGGLESGVDLDLGGGL